MAQRELSREEVEDLLARRRIVRLAFHASGRAYLIPLGYVWMDGALNVVTSEGTKSRMASEQPRVAFQVDDVGEEGIARWTSVTGEGAWELVEDAGTRARAIDELLRRFPELAAWGRSEYAAKESGGQLLVARVSPIWMTGRAFAPPGDP